jgi:hypothetical protein
MSTRIVAYKAERSSGTILTLVATEELASWAGDGACRSAFDEDLNDQWIIKSQSQDAELTTPEPEGQGSHEDAPAALENVPIVQLVQELSP